MIPRMFRLTGTDNSLNPPSNTGLLNSGNSAGQEAVGIIFLMKGVVPTSFTGLNTIGARSSDILCRFMPGNNAAGNFSTSQVNINPAVISTEYVAASASGQVTWFWWVAVRNVWNNVIYTPDYNAGLHHSAYGTVGTSGSGADLEMPSTNIVSGELYRIRNLRLQFPSTWTY